jgi:hypothetical protein
MKRVLVFILALGMLLFTLYFGGVSLHGVFTNHPSLQNDIYTQICVFGFGVIMLGGAILSLWLMKDLITKPGWWSK